MDATSVGNRKRSTASTVEQRLKIINRIYNSTPDQRPDLLPSANNNNNNNEFIDFIDNHDKQVKRDKIKRLQYNYGRYRQQIQDRVDSETHNTYNRIEDCFDENDEYTFYNDGRVVDSDFAMEVKRRLSLPTDVSIPNSFLLKLRDGGFFNIEHRQPLSRLIRRQSLLEIGFGQLATYYKLHVLGAGTYSTVYKGTSRLTNKLVALKEIHLERDEGVPFTAIREISLLKGLKHNNIITLHDIIYAQKTLTLVFEFVDKDLGHYLDDCDHKINVNNIQLFLYQLLRGLKHCHDRRILHRDLKPQNILISAIGELKLADFGLARAKSLPTKSFTDEVVTLWYRPPDVLLGNVEYGTSIDIWGVGCILFEMAAGHALFTGTSPEKQITGIFEVVGTPDQSSWPSIKSDLESYSLDIPNYPRRDIRSLAPRLNIDGIDLLQKFLECNPQARISAHDAMYHRYFSNLPDKIHQLQDHESIFSIESIKLYPEQLKDQLFHNV